MDEEILRLQKTALDFATSNGEKELYYEGRNAFKNLRIGIPRALEGIKISIGWGEIVVESLCDRINLDGVVSEDAYVIETVNDTDFKQQVKLAVRDSLIFGTSYILAQAGNRLLGEPEVLYTAESPMSTFGETDRQGNLKNLIMLSQPDLKKKEWEGVLILPNTTTSFAIKGNKVEVVGVDEHGLGYVPARKFVNQPRASKQGGKSEIDFSVRTMIDEAVRSYFGAATAREFFAAPQRYLLNVDLSQFKDSDGRPIDSWDAYMGTMLVAGTNKDKTAPIVGQFPASDPRPFLMMVEQYAKEVSAIKGIPVSDLGYMHSQPPSAESMEQQYSRLVKRAEDRISLYTQSVKSILFLGTKLTGRSVEGNIQPVWRNPRITSLGSLVQADGVAKLIQAGVFQPDSAAVHSFLGLSGEMSELVKEENLGAFTVDVEAVARELEASNESFRALGDSEE